MIKLDPRKGAPPFQIVPDPAPAPERRRERWVCVGSRVPLDGGGVGVVFHVLEEKAPEGLGTRKIFGLKNFRRALVGSVYDIEVSDSGAFSDTLSYVGPYADRTKAAEWEAEDYSRRLEANRLKLLKSAAKNGSSLGLELEALRRMYLKASDRTAFEFLVLKYLRRGSL